MFPAIRSETAAKSSGHTVMRRQASHYQRYGLEAKTRARVPRVEDSGLVGPEGGHFDPKAIFPPPLRIRVASLMKRRFASANGRNGPRPKSAPPMAFS